MSHTGCTYGANKPRDDDGLRAHSQPVAAFAFFHILLTNQKPDTRWSLSINRLFLFAVESCESGRRSERPFHR